MTCRPRRPDAVECPRERGASASGAGGSRDAPVRRDAGDGVRAGRGRGAGPGDRRGRRGRPLRRTPGRRADRPRRTVAAPAGPGRPGGRSVPRRCRARGPAAGADRDGQAGRTPGHGTGPLHPAHDLPRRPERWSGGRPRPLQGLPLPLRDARPDRGQLAHPRSGCGRPRGRRRPRRTAAARGHAISAGGRRRPRPELLGGGRLQPAASGPGHRTVVRRAAPADLRAVDGLRTAHRRRGGRGAARGRRLPGRPHPALAAGAGAVRPGLADRVVLQVRARPAGDGALGRDHVRRPAEGLPGLAAGLGRCRRPAPAARRRGRAARPAAVPGPFVAARRAGGVRRGAAPLRRPGPPGGLGPGAVGQRVRRRSRRRPGGAGGQAPVAAGAPDGPDRGARAGPPPRRRDRRRRRDPAARPADDGQPVPQPAPRRGRRARLAELRLRREPRRVGVRPVTEVRRRVERAGPRLRADQQRHLDRVLVPRGQLRRRADPGRPQPTTPGS